MLPIAVRMSRGAKAEVSDDPPPPGTAGHASGPITAMVFTVAGSRGRKWFSFFSSVMPSSAPFSAMARSATE
jgi:hypothetical protein